MELLKLEFFSEVKRDMDDITLALKDAEAFITDVLGKIKLPPDIDKQRLELSKRLRKLLNKSDEAGKKPPLPPPDQGQDQEFYDDVSQIAPEPLQETYDDVATVTGQAEGKVTTDESLRQPDTNAEESQELYDDIAQGEPGEPQETYDDVASVTSSLSRQETPVSSQEMGHITEPIKASEIQGRIYEGYTDKYKTKGLIKFSKWQRRFCVLTRLALYYYADPKDSKQKGTIVLPSTGFIVRKGCPSHPEIKDGKMCFELGNSERNYLFKVDKPADLEKWIEQIKIALDTKLTEEDTALIRTQSISAARRQEEDAAEDEGEALYEAVEQFNVNQNSSSSNETEPQEEMYEETEQFSVKETSGSSIEAPALPARKKPHDEDDDDDAGALEDYQPPDVTAPKPNKVEVIEEMTEEDEMEEDKPKPSLPSRLAASGIQVIPKSPKLPPRPPSQEAAPHLPPRSGASAPGSKQPPEPPTRTTPPTTKKTPEIAPKATEPSPPPRVEEKPDLAPQSKPGEAKPETGSPIGTTSPPPAKAKPCLKGELFDYARVYVALWNCEADDDDDLSFSRGNHLYVREKIPNSDWWVASLMDSPEIRVGLVPRNYIDAAYDV